MPLTIKYLFIDDDDQAALIAKLERANARLKIKRHHPETFDSTLSLLSPTNFKDYDGLLLDLRLNENRKPGQDYTINYRVSTLVQELRSRTVESIKLAPECPFILLSDETNISNYYRKDTTSHDLFDVVISKSEASDHPEEIATKLVSLVDGYKTIIDARSSAGKITSLNKLLSDQDGVVDQRITHAFDTKEWKVAANEYAIFVLKQIINKPGILINEHILAARLGVDINASKDWTKLLDLIPASVKYKGIFCKGWPRWWAQNLNEWWDGVKEFPENLRNIDANERVKNLKTKFSLTRLTAAKPLYKDYSSFFWTVCKARNLPLDPINGFMINANEPKPWQEIEYISTIAALNKEKYHLGLKVHPMELPKYKMLLKVFSQNG